MPSTKPPRPRPSTTLATINGRRVWVLMCKSLPVRGGDSRGAQSIPSVCSRHHFTQETAMNVEMLRPEGVFQSPAYAQVARVGDILFISGQTPRNIDGSTAAPGDIRGQAEKVFENLQAVLDSCGSSLDRVAKLTVYMTSYEYRTAISEVRA